MPKLAGTGVSAARGHLKHSSTATSLLSHFGNQFLVLGLAGVTGTEAALRGLDYCGGIQERGLVKGHKGNDSPIPILLEDWGVKMESRTPSSSLLGTENKNGDVASLETRK